VGPFQSNWEWSRAKQTLNSNQNHHKSDDGETNFLPLSHRADVKQFAATGSMARRLPRYIEKNFTALWML
jgi:hypothetical protein